MPTSPRPLLTAERALLRAVTAWGDAGADPFWEVFAPAWRDRLRAALEAGAAGVDDREEALRILQREHSAEARPDLDRVDPSWWVRALQDESPAVQRLITGQAPPAVRELVRRGLGLADDDLAPDHPGHPDALRWASTLWSERLVGGLPEREDDPAVIIALTRLDQRTLLRLVSVLGLAKRAYAPPTFGTSDEPVPRPLRGRDRDRVDHFHRAWGEPEQRLARVARRDRSTGLTPPRLGLVTIGRLLATAEPFRARWALQHLPYNVAKLIRSYMTLKHPLIPARPLLQWETRVFQMARDRLVDEGKLPAGFGGPA